MQAAGSYYQCLIDCGYLKRNYLRIHQAISIGYTNFFVLLPNNVPSANRQLAAVKVHSTTLVRAGAVIMAVGTKSGIRTSIKPVDDCVTVSGSFHLSAKAVLVLN